MTSPAGVIPLSTAGPAGKPAICIAIRDARVAAGLTQAEVGARLTPPCGQTQVSYWEKTREPDLDTIAGLERAMGYPRGFLLRMSGAVEELTSVQMAIASDPQLWGPWRTAVLDFYSTAVKRSQMARALDDDDA